MISPIKFTYWKRWISMLVAVCFVLTSLNIPLVQAQSALPAGGDFYLPAPGVRVGLSPEFNPPILKGIKVNPNNPFRFDFILDQGDSPGVIASEAKQSQQEQLKTEATRLIKYFLASLTIPEGDLWVNLSPYEKDRIIPKSFGLTEMGRDLLAEDYMLKQITASLIYPEGEVGKKFWKRIYEEAAKKFGTTSIPVNTFNKVWIVPEKAVVYENAKAGTAYVVESKLKVMLEQDYLLMSKHVYGGVAEGGASPASAGFAEHAGETRGQAPDINKLGSDIIREIVIPELTREINEGKNFAQLRQVYNSLILATWYKKKIKDSILSQVYADKKKIAGVGYKNSIDVTDIYQRYLQAFKKGVYNYIKEEQDPITQENIPRKYFSGGVELGVTELSSRNILKTVSTIPNPAMIANDHAMIVQTNFSAVDTAMLAPIDRAMNNADNQSAALRVIEEVRSWTRTTESPYPSKERKFSFAHDLAVVLVPKVSGKIDVCLVPDLPNDGVQQALLTIIRSKGMKAVKVQYPYGGQYELIVGSPMPVNRVLRVFEEQKQSKAEFDWALGLALNYPPGAIEKYIGAKKDNAQLAENNTREPDRAMVEEKAGAYQNIVVLPDRRFVNVFDSFEDDVSNPWESNFNMMDMDFRGWDSRLPASPKILCVGGSLREVQWYLRRYPNADITVVNLSRRVLGKLDEFVGNDPKRKQTIHLYLGDVTQLPTALFPQGSFDMVTAIRLEESAYEKYDFAAPLMGIVKAEMGLLKSGGFLVQPWLHGYKAYFQSFGALGLVKPFIRELQDAPPFFYERLAPEQTAGVSGLDHAMTGEIEVGDWFRSKANRNKAFIHAISVIDGIKYFFLTYAKMDKQERLVETGRDKLNLEELSNDFDRIEEPFKVGPAGQKSLSMTRIFGYHEGMRLKDDKDPTLGTGVVIDVDVRKEALTVLYLNGQQVVYNTFDRLTEIVTDDAGQPLPAKRLKATDYSIGEEVRDESRPELGVGHVISFLRDIRLEENGPAKSVLVQYHPAGGEGVQGFVYEEGIQGKNRLVDLVPAPALQGKGDFVTYTREFNDVGSLGTFIAMIDNGDIETPFNIRFDTEKRRYILEIYSSPLSSRLIQSKRISENSGLAADKEAYQQSEYAIATYKGYLDKLSETRDPHKLLDHNQVLFIGPDNQLKEVAYILERYPLIKKVVVAELSLKNVIAMSRKAFELGIQDKVEIVRMDFLKVNDLPGFWKGRFSAAFSCRVFEHTINTFEMIGNGWKAIQKVLARPGLFIGHLDLTDQGLAPSSTTDMLTVKEKALQREDDRMVVIADRAMVVKDKVDRGRVSLAYKKLRIDKTQFPQWRQQTQLLQVLEALRDRHWQVGEQVEEVVGEIAKERKDLLGMGVLPIMIDSLINERHVFRDRRSTAIEDAIRNRPDLISESVVSDLMNALKINKYYDVLEPGIKALGDIAAVRGDLINNEAVSILLTLLAHKESSIFEAAAVALGKIIKSRPEYVEEIWSKIPDITKIREEPQLGSAAALLGEIAKSQKTKLETAIQILLKMMNKRSNNVRFYASHALLEIVKAQADSLTQDDIILITKQFKAGRLLDSYGAQIFGEIAKVRAELLKEDVVKVLVEILKSTSTENYKLREICEALGEIARVREDLIQKAEKSLLEMSASDDKNLRKRAVDALVEIVRSKEGPSSGEIIKKLLNLLKIEKEGDVRNDVAAGLVQISEAQPQLLDESIMRAAFDIFNDVDESEWSNGARVLNAFAAVRGDLISPDITSNVRAKLRSKGDNRRSLGLEVIEGIAKMRGDLIDADTVDRVVALLGNENYFGTAFWGLQAFVSIVNSRGDLLTSNHMAAIVKLIVSGNRDFVKTGLSVLISIAKSQGKLIDEDIVKKVIQTLMVKNREEPKQGIAALVAIAQSRSDLRKGIVKTMIELLENKENYVRAKALEVLRKLVQSGTAVHLSKIVMRRIESLMGDDDWEVRQAAVGLMGEITKNASLDAQLGEDMKMFIMDQDHGFGLRPEDLSEGWSLLNAFGNQNDSWGIALFLDIIHEMSDYDQKIALVGLGNFYYQLKRFPKFIEILKASQGNVRELFQQLKDGVEDVTHSEDRIGDGWDGVSARLAEASQWKGPVLTGFIDKIIVTLRLLRQGAGRDLGFRQNANIEFRFPELKQNLITVLNNTQVPYQLKRRLFTSLPLGDAQEIDDLRNRAVLLVGEVTGLHQDNRTGLVGEIRQRIHNNPSVQDLPVVTAYREWVDSDGKRGTDKLIRFGLQVTPQDRVAPQRKTAVLAACDELLSSLRQVYGGGSEESLQRVIPVWQRAVGASSPAAEIRQGIEEVLQEGNFSEALLKLSDIRYRLKNMMQDMRGEALYQSIKLDLRLEIVLYRLFNSLEEKSKMTPQVLASMLRNLEASGYDRDLLEKKLTDLETITQGTNNDLKMYSWVKGLERFIQQEASESIEDYQALAESTARQLRVAPEDEIWVENFSSNLFRGDSIFLVSGLLNQMKNAVMTRAGISGWQVIVPGDMNGKLHYISDLKNINTLQDDEILVVDRLPSDSPVIKRARGIITLQEDSLLSHPAIRARQHGIPFLFCPDKKLIAEYFGQAVSIEVKGEDWVILKPSSDKEVVAKTGSEITPIILPKVVEEGAFIIEPDEYSASTVGNKAFNLGTMGSSRHLGLSFALYKRVLEDKENKAVKNQIKKIEDELANNPLDEGATKERLWQLRQLVNSLVIGQAIIQEISGAIIRRLGSGLIFLRSSTNAEDLLGYAGAGLYDSFGAVDPTDTVMLEKYIKKVWASVYNTRAYEDRQLNGIEHRDVRMAILAHKMVYVENTEGNIPQFSAVIHTRNPSSDNPQEMVVEIVQGLGEALVSGANEYQGSPYRFSYNRLTKAIKILAYANKDYRLVVQNGKLRRIFTDYRNDIFYLDSEKRNLILKEMFENAQRIEKNASGRSQDIEDCLIAVPQGYHLIDVQSRDQQGRQDKAQLAQLPVITAKKRRIKEFEILARQKAPVTVSQLIALLRAKNGYADVKADHVSKDVARDDRLKSHDKLIVKELDLEAVMARRAKELEILDRQKKPVTVSQLIALLRAEDGYADVKEGAVRYDVDYYLKGHDKISVREVDWKVVTARRAQELEILARQKTPVTVSQLIALLRAQDGYANVKTADVKNDVVLDEHLKGHNKLKKEVDQKAVAARRDKEVEILDRQETPVTVNQLIALLRAEDGYADVEADHVRADVARDERLKSHDKLIVKELDLEAVMARRDKEVEILARQKKPVTVSQLTTLLRAEDGYADVKVDTVRSDVAVDEHLKGPDKLKIGLEREVVAARHAKELEILARQKAPVTVSQLIALLRAENGYADLKAENVSNDVALYEPLKSHDKLIRRELDRKVVAARRTKELEILARQEAPVTVSQLTTLLRAEEGYADVKLGDVKNDVTHDQHLKGNDKLKKTVDRKAVAERLEAQELRELKQWIDGHSNRNITSVKLNSILAEFPHISRQTVEEDLSRSHIGIKDGVQLILDKAMEADRSGEEVTNNAGTSSQIPDEMTWGTIRTPWRTYPMTVKEDQDGTKKYIVSTGDFVFVKSKGVPVKLETRNVSSCTGIGIRIKNGKDEYYALAHIYNVHLVKAVSLIEQIRSIHTFLETVLGLNASRMDYVVDYRTDEYKEDSESSEQSIREEFTRSNFKFHRRIPYKIIDGVKVSSYPIDHISVTKHGVTIVANNQRTAPLLYEWSEAIGSGQTIGDRAMKAKGLDPDILSRAELYKDFLLQIGVRRNANIVDAGTGTSITVLTAAAMLGAHYVGFDLREDSKPTIDIFLSRHDFNQWGGTVEQRLGAFAINSPASRDIKDHSQDFVLMLTGVLSDPRPESDGKKALQEALRVINNHGKIAIGTFGFLGWERGYMQDTLESVLNSKEWEGKVRLVETPWTGERHIGATSIMNVYEVVFQDDKAMGVHKEKTGGIDLTPANMNVEIKKEIASSLGIKFHLDSAMLAQLQNAPGFVPVIINIQPVGDLKQFLGLSGKNVQTSG